MSRYPYTSRNKRELTTLRKGRDYSVWHKPGTTMQQLVSEISKPFIEIGGPTPDGFYFLENIELPSDVIITNISNNPLPYSSEAKKIARQVKEVMDARTMPYADNSVGCFLMSGMSLTSDWYMDLPEMEREKERDKIEGELDAALLEFEQVAIGTLKPKDAKYAQRVQIYLEVARTLAHNGLFFSDGTLTEIITLKNMGFELVACTQELIRAEQNWDGIFYEFVMQK